MSRNKFQGGQYVERFLQEGHSLTTAKYQLLLHSAAEVGDVTAALGDLGISNVGIVRVTRSDIDSLKEQVRLDAIHNAKSSAEALAGAIGQKIGKCFYIYDSNYDVAPQYYDNMMMVRSKAMMADSAEAGAPEEPSLDFKTIRWSITSRPSSSSNNRGYRRK